MANLNVEVVRARPWPAWTLCLLVTLILSATSHSAAIAQDTANRQGTHETRSAEFLIQQRVAELIERLGDPSFERRSNAEWALMDLGLNAFEQLRQAALEHPNIQVAKTAAYLIQSQNVVWYLETDSIDVRGYLTDYDSLSEGARISNIQALGSLGTTDAVLALCRLARFERHERVSKVAALGLLKFFSDLDEIQPELIRSIRDALGRSNRPAVTWIRQATEDLFNPVGGDIGAWQTLVQRELETHNPEARAEERKLLFDFFASCGVWLKQRLGDEAALEVVRPSLGHLPEKPKQVAEYAEQVLDQWNLPELVREAALMRSDLFAKNYELRYWWAEAELKLGDRVRSEQLANEASELIGMPPEFAKTLSKTSDIRMAELIASNRRNQAMRLASRGLFDWAEIEFRRALEENAIRFDPTIRVDFAEFYWLGGENQKAADVLADLVQDLEEDQDDEETEQGGRAPRNPQSIQQLLRETQNRKIQGNFYFYKGLAKTDSGESREAFESLKKALAIQPDNPDILIAMRRVTGSESARDYFDAKFTNMRGRFRREVVRAEEGLARAQDRDQRRRLEYQLAQCCNQLAWLLGKCESDQEEAIRLSERSLELMPDEPAFLDTLGRCYFSANRIDEAIEVQEKAISLAPHERLMVAQLEEFERARQDDKQ